MKVNFIGGQSTDSRLLVAHTHHTVLVNWDCDDIYVVGN